MSDETTRQFSGTQLPPLWRNPGANAAGSSAGKGRRKKKPRFTHCEDCGAELHGRYCSNCGQVAVDYHRSFRHVVADVAESFPQLGLEFTKTLLLLVIYPGWANESICRRASHALSPSTPSLPAGQHRLLFVHSSRSDSDSGRWSQRT